MAKIIQIGAITGSSGLAIAEITPALPGPGDVRLTVAAFALNRADLLAATDGHYFLAQLPCRLGWEAAGVVDAVGEGVSGVAIGDRVTVIPGTDFDHGAAGEFAIVPARFLIPWPAGYSAVEATSLCMQTFTAYFPIVELGRAGPGDTVLVTAGSSSAAIAAIQLARLQGASVIAQTRGGEKRDFILGVGADHVIASDHEDMAERMLALTDGKGCRLVYDCLGGSFVQRYLAGLAPRAQIFVYGHFSGRVMEIPMLPMVRVGATLMAYSLINYVRTDAELDRAKQFIARAVAAGMLRPVVDRVFPFAQALDAYRYMETGRQKGKIVVEVDAAIGG
jgi:NADPH:quinone reductase-like Zn-dependent oxidoreductase